MKPSGNNDYLLIMNVLSWYGAVSKQRPLFPPGFFSGSGRGLKAITTLPHGWPFLTILMIPPLKTKNESPLHKVLFNQKKCFVSGDPA